MRCRTPCVWSCFFGVFRVVVFRAPKKALTAHMVSRRRRLTTTSRKPIKLRPKHCTRLPKKKKSRRALSATEAEEASAMLDPEL